MTFLRYCLTLYVIRHKLILQNTGDKITTATNKKHTYANQKQMMYMYICLLKNKPKQNFKNFCKTQMGE